MREKLGGDVIEEGLEEELTGAEAAVAEAPHVVLNHYQLHPHPVALLHLH